MLKFLIKFNRLFLQKVPTVRRIVGIKYIDHHPQTRVEFVEGNIGDNQITIKVTASDHNIDSTFVFYSDYDDI